MENPPSLDMVYQAIVALYHNQNKTEREKASQWLGELQKSVYSWRIADEMLHEKRDVESCYFAAQTMRTKIQYSFHELPPEAHISLRDSLIQHLEQVTDFTNSVIVTQLCLALAVLALQMPAWEKPVVDLMNRFGSRSVRPLLEVLTALPEEINSKSLRLGENRRQQVLDDLSNCSSAVSELLKACLTNCDNQQIHIKVLRCFTSWISVRVLTLNDVNDNLVAVHAFSILQNQQISPSLHEAATECVCSLLQSLEFRKNQSLEFQTLDEQLFRGVVALEDSYHLAVAHEDQDKCITYSRIFTELGESLLEKILNTAHNNKNHYSLKVLDLVLLCVGHHDYEVAEITFNFWYRLSEELCEKNSESLTLVFRPFVERLIESLCRHSRMEQDQEGLLDECNDFAEFRRKVSELLKDVVLIVGPSNCFRQMFLSLQAPGVTWDITEAALFFMQSVAKIISPEDKEVVPQVVKAILESDPDKTHVAVRNTSVLLLGELHDWIDLHSHEILDAVVYFLLYCLRQPPLTPAAANSLLSICSTCCDKVTQHFQVMAEQMVETLKSSVPSQVAVTMIKTISIVLGRMPPKDIYPSMKSLCWVQLEPLRKLNESDINSKRGTPTDPVVWFDRLACIFRNTNPNIANGSYHPCSAVFTEIWPVLSETCNKFQSDIRIMERCCRCLRFAVRCAGRQCAHLIPSIVQTIVPLYNVHKHSCFLYLGSILVDECACDSQCVPVLLDMLQVFVQSTFQVLEEENGLKNHPDTVDDFFRLCARFLQRIPVEFLQCPALPAILECALFACSLDHKDANASTMKFFYDLLLSSRSGKNATDSELRKQLVSAVVRSHGKRLVETLLHASVFSLHSYMLGGVADVFMELLDMDRACVREWLLDALKNLPTQNHAGSTTATEKQLEDFHHSFIRAQSNKEVTKILKEFARLYW